MGSTELMKDILMVLDRAGFDLSEVRGGSVSSFDIISRRDQEILIVKVLDQNMDMDRAWSNEMVAISRVLEASPLVIVRSSGSSIFRDGVIYLRMGVPLMTFNTLFDHLIEGVPPMIYKGSTGFFVSLDGDRIRDRRSELGISLGALADKAGVSRKAVQMYEKGMGADIEVALKIEQVLNTSLILPLDPFSYSDELQTIRECYDSLDDTKKQVFRHLDSLGIEVVPALKCPFDALARAKVDLFLTSISGPGTDMVGRVRTLKSVGRVTGADPLIITKRSGSKIEMDGIPILGLTELRSSNDIDDLINKIRERSLGRMK